MVVTRDLFELEKCEEDQDENTGGEQLV